MRVLLISSSNVHGTGYLDHAEPEIRDFLGSTRRVLFFPWALRDLDGYGAKVRGRLGQMGFESESAHDAPDPVAAVEDAEAVFVGGGNTFRLLKTMYEKDLLVPLRRRVLEGMPYVGSSAGSNVACASIRSTNDMPVVEPPSLTALGLVPFNLNPHYLDPDPTSTHKGETREERIAQFHEENEQPVVGLREGAILRIEGGNVFLRGIARARLFRKGEPPAEFSPGDRLDFLLRAEIIRRKADFA
jgi:dipeptidase E